MGTATHSTKQHVPLSRPRQRLSSLTSGMNREHPSATAFTSRPKVQKYKCYWLTVSPMTHVKDTYLGHRNIR